MAAAWDRDLTRERALAMANEFKDKGVNFWLGPVTGGACSIRRLQLAQRTKMTDMTFPDYSRPPTSAGPLGRSPLSGRNFEGFSADPYLSGENSYITVKAGQENGLMAVSKHYIFYEQETFRRAYLANETSFAASSDNYEKNIHSRPIDMYADDKTTHETYLWSFAEAVRAGTAHIMCSYNEVNGTHACQNDVAMNKILKGELNFQGSVVSDWGGDWTNALSALGGLDITMPGSGYQEIFGTFFGKNLVKAVKKGDVPEARLDDMALRILGPSFHFQGNWTTDWPEVSFNALDTTVKTNNVRRDHYKIIKKIGEESVTLVKNNRTHGHGLPLKNKTDISSIAIIGEDAGPQLRGATSCGDTYGTCTVGDFRNGTNTAGGGSGWAYPPYVSDLLAALTYEARDAGYDINANQDNYNITAAAGQAAVSEVALVSVAAYATEGSDRQNLTAFAQGDKLVKAVAEVNNNTIVIVHGPGPILVEEWIENPNVTAVLFAYYPGQEAGNSLVPILFGDKSPSGRLPFTIGKKESDYPDVYRKFSLEPELEMTEGNNIDYKYFEANDITPRYHFGHGLTYSSFDYGNLSLAYNYTADTSSIQTTNETFSSKYGEGDSVYDQLLSLSVDVTNTGDVEAAEVAQLYLTFPGAKKVHHLRGFEKLWLAAGETGTATFSIRRKDVSLWSTVNQEWYIPEGEFVFEAGKSVGHLSTKATYEFVAN